MRHYHRTIQITVLALSCFVFTGFIASGMAWGEEPGYPAAPPVTQSDGYGVVPYAPYSPTMVKRPDSWPQGSLRQPGTVSAPSSQASTVPQNNHPTVSGTQPYFYPSTAIPSPYPSTTTLYDYPSTNCPNTNPHRPIAVPYNAPYGSPVPPATTVVPRRRVTDLPFSATAEIKPLSDARILARVGNEVILAGDVLSLIASNFVGKLEKPIPEKDRDIILQNFLRGAIETKLIYADVVRTLPAEGVAAYTKQLQKNFTEDKDQGLPALLKKAKVKTREELEKKLQVFGSSLEAQKRLYVERMITGGWIAEELKLREPITHEQMLTYYNEHVADYEHKPRAEWEQLSVLFDKHHNKQEAYQIIVQAGNKVLQGVPFAAVAKQHSEGATADEGGRRSWTEKGSLISEKLDAALFGLPVGSFSRIIEDEKGYHIVRVTQRKEAYRTPFHEVQADIEKTLRRERSDDRVKEYLVRLKKETIVWTAYDDKKERQQNIAEKPENHPMR